MEIPTASVAKSDLLNSNDTIATIAIASPANEEIFRFTQYPSPRQNIGVLPLSPLQKSCERGNPPRKNKESAILVAPFFSSERGDLAKGSNSFLIAFETVSHYYRCDLLRQGFSFGA